MHDHFFHLLIATLPLAAIALLILWRNRSYGVIKSAIFMILFLVISLQALPFHYLHAAHSQDLQTYQCCAPVPITTTASFNIVVPTDFPVLTYFLQRPLYDFVPTLTLNSRGPPIV